MKPRPSPTPIRLALFEAGLRLHVEIWGRETLQGRGERQPSGVWGGEGQLVLAKPRRREVPAGQFPVCGQLGPEEEGLTSSTSPQLGAAWRCH